ncbi:MULTISPECIES: glycosyl hydrolase [Robinsoniella]|uniref:glycosyl hydrolase n=1 Tax=Robinsoniella TaxID=588605 RepID=UPI00048662E7|nr:MULTISPECIES: glycosyl hydrolase [Robinsoniella]
MGFQLEKFMEELKNPSAIMRTAPLWVWNDTMTDCQIDHALDELKSHGFGGAIVHPRPGMVITYLSAEWFEQWGYALDAAKKRGMKLYIYDENSYPSGFGGGHVSAELPDCLGTSVSYQLVHKDQLKTKEKAEKWFDDISQVRVFACEKIAGGKEIGEKIRLLKDITQLPGNKWAETSDWFIIMGFVKGETTGWMAGFANVDLLRREVTDTFIEKVYQPYYDHFGGEFGKAIPAIFMDEPAITGSGVYGTAGSEALPYSYWFSHEFYKRNGYHLEDYLPSLFTDAEAEWFVHTDKEVRHDYYDTTRELWVRNFVLPLSRWCEEHGIALTGHYMEDDWPRASAGTTSPNIMANFEYMGWPAIDMLVNDKLLERPNEHVGLIMQELRSAVNQFGQERCFCEAFGAGGWDSTLADFKRIGDWLMVNGVNFINEHLTYTSYIGARKRDHPQSFDWRQPWWEQFTGVNDYFGRVCALLSQGHMEQRVLLMHPTLTGYMRIMDGEPSGLVVKDDLAKTPDMRPYYAAMQQLIDDQWDFDLGNEDIIKRHGKSISGRIQLKNQEYQVILITGEMKNMLQTTVDLLEKYLDEGGHVISLGIPGGYVEGRESHVVEEKLCHHKNWIMVNTPYEMSGKLREFLNSRIEAEHPFETGVEHMRRVLDEKYNVYYFVNHSLGKVKNVITLDGRQVKYLDLWDGKAKVYPYQEKDGKVSFSLDLDRYESAMFLVGQPGADESEINSTDETFSKPAVQDKAEIPVVLDKIQAESKNSMIIDYCDLELDGRIYKDMCALFAGKEVYRHRGYPDNPWDNQVQYKRRYLDSNLFGEGTGFTASYRFSVEDVPEIVELAAEQGQQYEVMLNGKPVIWREGYYLDDLTAVADIAGMLKKGENIVVLKTDRFDVRLEVEPVYIRGEFHVVPREGIWTITKKEKLQYGTWIEQGYPMYEGAVLYSYTFSKEKAGKVIVSVPQMETTCASLFVNGIETGLVGVNGNYLFDITEYCVPGNNEIIVRVCGGFKNLLGPHHCADQPRRSAWPEMWRQSPRFGRPGADKYDLIPYGMQEGIRVFQSC